MLIFRTADFWSSVMCSFFFNQNILSAYRHFVKFDALITVTETLIKLFLLIQNFYGYSSIECNMYKTIFEDT